MSAKIIAFTGLPVTGKSTARETAQELLEQNDIPYAYVHFGTTEEVEKRNASGDWEDSEKNLTMEEKERLLREKWRSEKGMGVMAEVHLPAIQKHLEDGKIILIDNLYSDEERQVLAEHFGKDALVLVTMAADWKTRVRRGANRPYRPLSPSQLKSRDEAEVYNLHKAATIALADYTIVNNHNEQEDPEGARRLLKDELLSRVLADVIK